MLAPARKAAQVRGTKSSSEVRSWEEPNAVEVHVGLVDIAPEIWRRLLVPLDTTLAELHHILQAAMGWTDSHLHSSRS